MKHALKYADWCDSFNWDTCKLKNKEFGQFISSYLRSSNKLVANLNSEWGSGKTNFLKRLYIDLAENNHPVIYIDAWESDYSKHPLSVVSAELFQQLTSILASDDVHLGKVTDCFNRVLSFAKPIARLVSASQPDSEYQQISNVLEVVPDLPNGQISNALVSEGKTLVESVKDAHFEQVEAMRGLKNQLELVASILGSVYELKMPVVVLVDELDRCRPNYAIEFLEVIKHFFEIDNFVFLCASDTKQLCASIKTIYGSEFDAETYLKRFFERTITLPKPEISEYIKSRGVKQSDNAKVTLHPSLDNEKLFIDIFSKTISLLSRGKAGGLSLRDVDQIIAKYEAIIFNLGQSGDSDVDVVVLITMLTLNQVGSSDYTLSKFPLLAGELVSGHELREVIKNQFLLAQEVIGSVRYRFGGRSTEYGQAQKMLALEKKGPITAINTEFQRSHEILIKNYSENPAKYLLIEDYKKLVELSGAIL
ncbi:P-loop NTPase fold protein [Rheinheimera baltica]|uniref:P-loop NTPase fold protein n=1 Tax=Rheinheimera baltica TaxID=67576 RepID=A0ABT9I3R3_9GAMM|nr:P-loop NTPase fold protein [Rheinheimera baltica]MDP5137793.1 P-loop NTPase fold protein [Rheinheimera baltica]